MPTATVVTRGNKREINRQLSPGGNKLATDQTGQLHLSSVKMTKVVDWDCGGFCLFISSVFMYFMTLSFSTRFTEISKCSLAYQTLYQDPDKTDHTSNTLRYDLRPAVGGPFHNLLIFFGFHLELTYEIPSGGGTLERCAFDWDNQSSAES